MVIRRAATLIAIGVALGLAGAVALSSVLDTTLAGITANRSTDVCRRRRNVLLVVAVACVVPAGRAATLNPIAALRHD